MTITVIIPSRYGSTRFEGKPLAKICGKSMIQRVYESASRAENVDQVVVATDDTRIADAVGAFGGKAVMTGEENRTGSDRVGEAALKIGLKPGDIIINVQGDQPLLDPRCIDQVVAPLLNDPSVEMTTLAYSITNPDEITNPKDVKVVMDAEGFALYFSRSSIPFGREPDEIFETYKHLGIYAYTFRFLEVFRHLPEGRLERIERLEQLRVLEHGHRLKAVVTEYDSPEVDLPDDIVRIEGILLEG